ncbi:MAG TPA: hypothetical protein VND93_33605 [Myxococcales bacterium]|nr:hypothetical protein [Myxococcales bacterium]
MTANAIGAPSANVIAATTSLLGEVAQLLRQAQPPAAAPQDAFVGANATATATATANGATATAQAGAGAGADAGGAADPLAQALGSLSALVQQLVQVLQGGTGSTGSPSSPSTPPSPSSPSSPSSPNCGPGVFIVGDLKKFGGGTVRAGLEDMLRPTKGLKDRAGERTHSQLSPEQAQQVQALLNSNDPAVRATLNTQVPSGKSLVIGQDGHILETLDTKDVVANQSLGVGVHAQHMHDAAGRNYDRSAGGQINGASNSYNVIGTELHSPIKIALDGKDARLDSTHGFQLDADGFGRGQGAVSTSGGLNPNEAWLVRDKAGDGVTRNGVVDGNDVYGDHNGQFKDGYQELARDYQGELKTDPATGHRYIDLTDPNSRAAKELKLLDASGRQVPASSVLTRIDVDAAGVKETDATGRNQIRERAQVTYRDGHTATSADQWYAFGQRRG